MALGERSDRFSEASDRLSFVSLGFLLVLIGVIVLITPNPYEEAVAFFKDFKLVKIYPKVSFPAPASSHSIVYRAAMGFCIAFALSQIAILVLRFVLRDSFDRKVGTLSGIVFWLGAGYLLSMLTAETINWFPFLGGLIILVGLSLVVRSLLALLFGVVRREH